jgi:hypothetical protein
MKPETTSIELLSSDGRIRITFEATLTPEQFGELLNAVNSAETIVEVSIAVNRLGKKWNCVASVGAC